MIDIPSFSNYSRAVIVQRLFLSWFGGREVLYSVQFSRRGVGAFPSFHSSTLLSVVRTYVDYVRTYCTRGTLGRLDVTEKGTRYGSHTNRHTHTLSHLITHSHKSSLRNSPPSSFPSDPFLYLSMIISLLLTLIS